MAVQRSTACGFQSFETDVHAMPELLLTLDVTHAAFDDRLTHVRIMTRSPAQAGRGRTTPRMRGLCYHIGLMTFVPGDALRAERIFPTLTAAQIARVARVGRRRTICAAVR